MSGTAADVIAVAKGEVGYHEGMSGGHWDNIQKYSEQTPGLEWSDGAPWCAVFVSWCAMRAGAADLFPRTASVAEARDWFKERGRFSAYPAIGAQVIYGTSGDAHTGLVHAYDADYLYAVEGNSNVSGSPEGDGVYLKKRARRDAYVYGYGYPDYPGGITSADPNATAPAPTAPPFPGAGFFGPGQCNPYVTQLGERLVAKGYGGHYRVGPSPEWGEADRLNVRDFQLAQGWSGADADGIPGPETWRRLWS